MPNSIPPECLSKLELLRERFSKIDDPRQASKVEHTLGEILMICLCATLCGCGDGPSAIAMFGTNQEEWLRLFLPLRNGIPSHDTFNNVLGVACPAAVAELLGSCVGEDQKTFNIDGKVLRGSAGSEKPALCIVRAWADGARMSAGQVSCEEKSNEIEAIPRLLASLELEGATVTIDAAGCQTQIAAQIDKADGSYVLALKANHKGAYEAAVKHFDTLDKKTEDESGIEIGSSVTQFTTEEVNRGRYEARTCTVESDLGFFSKSWKWAGITCVARVRSEVCRSSSSGADGAEATIEDRFYLCSCASDAEGILEKVRGHWSVENRCHWVLDVVFGEDGCRISDKNTAHNLSMLRELAAHCFHKAKKKGRESMKMMQLQAALDPVFRLELLQ